MNDEIQARISILLADDHRMLVDALAPVLALEPDFDLRTAATFDEVIESLKQSPSDVVLLDLKMPGMSGLASVKQVIDAAGDGKVALFSGNVDDSFARIALHEGAAGFIPKTTRLHVLPWVIRLVATGSKYMPVNHDNPASQQKAGKGELNDLELRIMQHIKSGLTNKEIARRLMSSEVRVKMHLRTVFAKLGARNRAHAAEILSARGAA